MLKHVSKSEKRLYKNNEVKDISNTFNDVIHWCPLTRDACIREVMFAPHKDRSKEPVSSCSDCSGLGMNVQFGRQYTRRKKNLQ